MNQKIYAAVRKKYPQESNKTAQLRSKKLWYKLKGKKDLAGNQEKAINKLKDIAFRAKAKLTGFFTRAMQSKTIRLPVANDSDQETPVATNENVVQEVPATVIDEELPISLDGRNS